MLLYEQKNPDETTEMLHAMRADVIVTQPGTGYTPSPTVVVPVTTPVATPVPEAVISDLDRQAMEAAACAN